MTKEELIIKWQKEFDYYQDKLDKDKSTDISQLYMAHFETRQIRAFIEDIKNLTVETVKLRESCPHSESVMLIRAFVCKKCGTILDKLEAD